MCCSGDQGAVPSCRDVASCLYTLHPRHPDDWRPVGPADPVHRPWWNRRGARHAWSRLVRRRDSTARAGRRSRDGIVTASRSARTASRTGARRSWTAYGSRRARSGRAARPGAPLPRSASVAGGRVRRAQVIGGPREATARAVDRRGSRERRWRYRHAATQDTSTTGSARAPAPPAASPRSQLEVDPHVPTGPPPASTDGRRRPRRRAPVLPERRASISAMPSAVPHRCAGAAMDTGTRVPRAWRRARRCPRRR